jgi:Rod binding domain-containing protein
MDLGNASLGQAMIAFQTRQDVAQKMAAMDPKKAEGVKKAAEDFEAMFLSEMLSPAFDSIETGGPFGGGHGEEVFRSLMVQEYGRQIAASGQTGIADMVQKAIIDLQEKQGESK